MKRILLSMLLAAQSVIAAPKSDTPGAGDAGDIAHRSDDIARHRQIARAHEEAAQCLASKEKESVCHQRLREACKGIAIGKFCGMRHD